MKNSNNTLKAVGSLLIGAATGAALGILFAPHKGSKTRKQIASSAKKMSKELKKKMKEEVKDFKSKAEKVESDIENKFKHLLNVDQQEVEDIKSKM